MTHEYTLLVGGLVIPGGSEPDATAIAWADGTVLAIGGDSEVRSISRGDSHVVELRGAVVVPLGERDDVAWPAAARLETGGPADIVLLDGDPRAGTTGTLAVVRGGHVIEGAFAGLSRQVAPPA
jgi:imidazolonepropionase-like amidohydrolase